ncbi:MAG: GNAT family N-acetyltransferase [Muribaculum sp.]|nr:GNAT family N-acetyltransferase [Muribaculaceae bacterium]MCM1081607.1 GNAT family N-acetyltransferase [Muribaculum sp.]
MRIHIIPYSPSWQSKWNRFNRESKNGTFLFDRNYMDYHSDRFHDCSLIAIDDEGNIVAALPATRTGDTATSHGGLTYGGWILSLKKMDAALMLEVWDCMSAYYKSTGIKNLIYKVIPWIYPIAPSDDDLYAIFRNNGTLDCVQVSTAIDLTNPVGFNRSSRTKVHKAARNGAYVKKNYDFATYWQILTKRLQSRHNTNPVHALDEIILLASRFPEEIELWSVFSSDHIMIAGSLIYKTRTVAHAQYIAASDAGLEQDALPLLFDKLITHYTNQGCRYFDFGTSNEQRGMVLNSGLLNQKQRFGGRTVAYTTYRIEL